MHFTPTGAPWLNLIEPWFREIAVKRIRRDVFHGVRELIEAFMDYITHHNPRRFRWTAGAEDSIRKVQRAHKMIDKGTSE